MGHFLHYRRFLFALLGSGVLNFFVFSLPIHASVFDPCKNWLVKCFKGADLPPFQKENMFQRGKLEFPFHLLGQKLSINEEAAEFFKNGIQKLQDLNVRIKMTEKLRATKIKSSSILRSQLSDIPYKSGILNLPDIQKLNLNREEEKDFYKRLLFILAAVQVQPTGPFTVIRHLPWNFLGANQKVMRGYMAAISVLEPKLNSVRWSSLFEIIRILFAAQNPFNSNARLLPKQVDAWGLVPTQVALGSRTLIYWAADIVSIALISYGLYAAPYIYDARMKFVQGDTISLTVEEQKQVERVFRVTDQSPWNLLTNQPVDGSGFTNLNDLLKAIERDLKEDAPAAEATKTSN